MKFIKTSFLPISLMFILSCSGSSETSYEPVEQPDSSDMDEYKVTPQEFLDLPFTISVLGNDHWETKNKITQNHHDKSENDTIVTMRFKESLVHFHNHDLLDAFLVNDEVHLVKHIHVGMTREQFVKVFKDLENHKDAPYVEISDSFINIGCCSERNGLWEFKFDADTIYEIDYHGYMD